MSEIEELKKVVKRLRADDGCPWDREQTHESLKPGLIEEASEVIGGINIYNETGNSENFKEELGDLLLQIVMHGIPDQQYARKRRYHQGGSNSLVSESQSRHTQSHRQKKHEH